MFVGSTKHGQAGQCIYFYFSKLFNNKLDK